MSEARLLQGGWEVEGSFHVFDQQWQSPARTEQHAYDMLRHANLQGDWAYIAFPWATMIDCLERRTRLGRELSRLLQSLPGFDPSLRIITVCQHIKFKKYLHIMANIGVTDVFASHTLIGEKRVKGVNLHPFQLFAAQVDPDNLVHNHTEHFNQRPYLYSFAGAFNPDFYLSDVRDWIFNLPSREDAPVIRRGTWHFEKRIYNEQVYGKQLSHADLTAEQSASEEYVALLRKSRFTLCPSGTGPNSIRLWEALELGSIPVILSDTLALPGSAKDWEDACVFVPETKEHVAQLPKRLEQLAKDHNLITAKLTAVEKLRSRLGLADFASPICNFIKHLPQQNAPSIRNFYLDTTRLSAHAVDAWREFFALAAKTVNAHARVFEVDVDEPTGGNALQSVNWPGTSVAHISDARTLSPSLLDLYTHISVVPQAAPQFINADLALLAVEQGFEMPDVEIWQPVVSLATSIFNGDDYLYAFLENAGKQDAYDDMEHFLMLADSPGREYASLFQYIKSNPGAVFVWLCQDPGLYNIWNLCRELASAPYCGNFNIDDKRAPKQVVALASLLNQSPHCHVASSALRVTDDKNITWEQSGGSKTWYGHPKVRQLNGKQLYRLEGGHAKAHNFPHCLPIWRSSLAYFVGTFQEDQFGPSSDWEYWLRAARYGASFITHGEALGLYYRAPQSYWRRNPAAADFDQKIAATHISESGELKGFSVKPGLLARDTVTTLLKNREDEFLIALTMLLKFTQQTRTPNPKLLRLIEFVGVEYFGGDDLSQVVKRCFAVEAKPSPHTYLDLCVEVVTELFHLRDHVLEDTALMMMKGCRKLYRRTADPRFLVLTAFVQGLAGNTDAESQVLDLAVRLHGSDFYEAFRFVYRQRWSLSRLTGRLAQTDNYAEMAFGNTSRVIFFPDYSHSNPYQKLLYQNLHDKGVLVEGIADSRAQFKSLATQTFSPGDVVHLHWLNPILKGKSSSGFPGYIARFLDTVAIVQDKGAQVYWSVHNLFTHDALDIELESNFRHQLSRSVNKVFLHHPAIKAELSWLDPQANIEILEHGNYTSLYANDISSQQARIKLGLNMDDVVVVVFGQIRPYKELFKYLPCLRDAMLENKTLKLIVAGKISCHKTRDALKLLPPSQLILENRFIENDEYQVYLNAASFALLTYRHILTSGSLFQAMGFSLPVLAPRLGSIPAYIADGYNGFLYTPDDFADQLSRICKLNETQLQQMSARAHEVAISLHWPE